MSLLHLLLGLPAFAPLEIRRVRRLYTNTGKPYNREVSVWKLEPQSKRGDDFVLREPTKEWGVEVLKPKVEKETEMVVWDGTRSQCECLACRRGGGALTGRNKKGKKRA
ncbi:hypothetical protein AJ79_03685 [Helicocarpus griseus UAMH5409]|uniref:Uncharacterized protein n=1 Tax=Helicocarpus griseus UAMH5409 TaxID=1447875 RepID=A0A2B7XW40_9EURO|nr:hypothetical protein AJ79_03685 [Helicocarpus griseus UAMH5409]